ncbi:MAG: outer membrane protein assembly factor BamA [Candidatus Solibacter usitatus]|nr:outer membrane protein assembly factor BamA [Candidatus Solibacter usitatus]
MTHRRRSLEAVLLCLVVFLLIVTGSAGILQAAQQASPQAPKPAEAKKTNPFESVPGGPTPQPPKPAETPKPQQPKPGPFETVPQTKPDAAKPAGPEKPDAAKPAEGPQPPQAITDTVEVIEFRGARRVPQDTLRALIFTKKGDRYDAEALHRDFMALWNTGRFDDITLEREAGKIGWIVRFLVTERRVVRSIKYEGNKSITVSEILDRFKDRRVGLAVEQQFEQGRVQRAANVLKEFLSERGRQFATVTPEIKQIPPSSIEVTFRIQEGAKVKVGKIDIVGNKVFGDRAVIRAMKNLKPIGIPHGWILEGIFPRTFDSTKLEEDKDRIRMFYTSRGYFLARATDHKVNMRDTGGGRIWIPPFKKARPGKTADLTVNLEEGLLYKLNQINFVGVKLFRTPETLMRPLFGMGQGDIFSTEKLSKGFKNLQKLYGEFGYIDAVPEPDFNPMPDGKIDLTINVDEGKQFFVRRIDFQGNTTTRDKVIRREIMIDEGDMYNTRLWEMSVLRLNQLGYFEQLKAEEAANITRDTKNNTVDITLKVKERGKNSISLNGGVSGIAGTFIGFGYATNNFLGLGETLSLNAELGDRMRNVTFGFTEPYLFDKPIQAGFTIYTQRFNYDQAREVSLFSGRNLIPLYNALGTDNLLMYNQKGFGATVFASYPLKRSFARLSLTYGIDNSTIVPGNTSSSSYFNYSNFLNFDGPNSLNGIITSRVIPSYTYNTVDHPITPSRGRSLFASISFAGGPLGGNVNLIEPTVSATYFRKGFSPKHVIGMRVLGRILAGYGGKVAPPFNRVFMGGEQDVRGFEIWGIGPFAYIPSEATTPVLNSDGSARTQKIIVDGKVQTVGVTQTFPIYQLVFPGGDTQGIANFEYRIPIFGPLVLAAFFDAGVNRISLPNQLRLNPSRLTTLNGTFPQAGFDNRAYVISSTQQLRTSTGLELQIMMPVVNAPFRLYYAYNPTIVSQLFTPPVAAEASMFPNYATYAHAAATFARPSPYMERRTMFRFTISRTF